MKALVKKGLMPAVLLATLAQTAPARAQESNWKEWTITKDSWSETDERRYSEWVQALGESGCRTVDKCLKDSRNFLANSAEKASVSWSGDCGRFPYILRAYFAWKNKLPFGYVSGVAAVGETRDLRYSPQGNRVTARSSIVQSDARSPIDGVAAVKKATRSVYTAMHRFNPDSDMSNGLFFDLYPVKVTRDQIKPGTVLYDPNGHVAVVYKVEADGRIRFFDAHPDDSVTRGVYGEKFIRSRPGNGAGFKNFRPIKLVGATRLADGRLIGGKITTVANAQIPGYSKEQYYGTHPDANSWSKGKFIHNGTTLEYYDFVRTRLALGDLKYHPVEEMVNGIEALCGDLEDRVHAVDGAIAAGTHRKAQPDRLPRNIYGTDGEWEEYSTPSRDARLKASFRELRTRTEQFIQMYNQRNPRIDYKGSNLIRDLRAAYEQAAGACKISYKKSNGAIQTLTFDEVAKRLFLLSFDPYHCVERRWGAYDTAELNSCADGSVKQAWYQAEQRLRNQIERTYDTRMDFNLAGLRSKAPGSGVDQAPDVDLKTFLDRQ